MGPEPWGFYYFLHFVMEILIMENFMHYYNVEFKNPISDNTRSS